MQRSITISTFLNSFNEKLHISHFQDGFQSYICYIQNYVHVIVDDFHSVCESPVSIEEIRETLNSINKRKSPGPDGLSVEFYRQFWEVLEDPFLVCFKIALKRVNGLHYETGSYFTDSEAR